ncbi:MAG: hypothetical protein NTU44_20335 [Bacteroidetes bacterium]|nr:hypothetical protein [Bacteroidota bacterium]
MKVYLLFFLAAFFLLVSCQKGKRSGSEHPLARVHDIFLYESDLAGVVLPGTPSKDSIDIVKNFIQNWIRQKLVVYQAENNLNRNQKDFAKELEEYRNSLIVYRYESRLIKEKLDTVVTQKQIEDYYNQNQGNFELKDNIVRVLYVKLKVKDPSIQKIKSLLRSDKPADRQKLTQLAAANAVNSYLDDKSWLFFNDLLKEIPIKTYDQEDYLQNHRMIEFSDDSFTYLINIVEFKIKEGLSPLSLEMDNIKNILINKRKTKLVNDMENDVYNQALKNKDFETF